MRQITKLIIGVLIVLMLILLLSLKYANSLNKTFVHEFKKMSKPEHSHKLSDKELSQLPLDLKSPPVATYTHKSVFLPQRVHYPLGSEAYLNDLKSLLKTISPRRVFDVVIDDVSKYSTELDTNPREEISHFYKAISELVDTIGIVDEEMHFFRNGLNRSPDTLADLMNYNATAPPNRRWKLLSALNSAYHLQGKDGIYNLKFVSYDGYCESVYDKNGKLLDSKSNSIDMGTFNYSAGIYKPNAHKLYDIQPYIIYGNTKDSLERSKAIINYNVDITLELLKDNSMNVYAYRKELFGKQEGTVE